jgi:hypothetical protein
MHSSTSNADSSVDGGSPPASFPSPSASPLRWYVKTSHRPCCCELGDGAVTMGAWHESLNLAALWSLPVVFLVVNNEYGMGTSVERASAEPELYKRACAFRMHGERVDGDDYGGRGRERGACCAAPETSASRPSWER